MRRSPAARRLALFAATALAVPGSIAAVNLATQLPAAANTCTTRTAGDTNGDGRSDVLVGQPNRAVGSAHGAISVIRGDATAGLTTTGNQYVTDSSLGLAPMGTSEIFGLVGMTGFFDSDCYADAIIGVTSSDGTVGGLVAVAGSSSGLNLATAKRFTAAQIAAGTNQLGTSIAVADFNHDGYDDVAVGAFGTNSSAGGVGVLYGSSTGLTLTGHQWFTEDTVGVPGTAEPQAQFGRSIAAGDFNHDGYADLVVGVPGESVTRSAEAGAVIVLPGSGGGLTATGSTIFSEDTPGVPGVAEDDDEFGFAVGAGDVTGDGYADVVVGVLSEVDHGAFGAVFVLPGSPSGVTATGSRYTDQSSAGFPASPTMFGFGSTIAVGDFNHDGYADIGSGAGATVVDQQNGAGAFAVLHGSPSGLTTTGSAIISEDTPGVPGTAEEGDDLGIGIQPIPVTGTGYAGLVVAVPFESSSGANDNGGVEVFNGAVSGIVTTGARYLDGSDLTGGIANNSLMGDTQPFDNAIG